ncbi:MAG TPA: c-type cytochrome biogenesis protein CcsB [Syntrophorhabdaceae bacterium]|nr:c-type cytochrome biogenesis protein CcsB [Syntrophorhabdaceae bacterium]
MTSSIVLGYVTFAYFFVFLFYLLAVVSSKGVPGSIGNRIFHLTLAVHTCALLLRWYESYQLGVGHVPLANFYESLIFFTWTISLLYFLIKRRTQSGIIGLVVMPFIFLGMAYASFSGAVNSGIQPLVPALRSNWLIVHVITCFIGYAAFTIAFAFSITYIWQTTDENGKRGLLLRHMPSTRLLNELMYEMTVVGFLMLTIGIVTGSVWAHSAWGSYWTWDPKETWSLITWLVYAAILHAYGLKRWHGKKLAVFSAIGFSCVLFTYFGVNYLQSLHSYGLQ